ncbi:MAG: ATP-binding cassette domain-containing protein [Negativicutes bacterium]|nr:ATP-binding cassette domain-containing protein [Negativicutes bacterium]
MWDKLRKMTIDELVEAYPHAEDFFLSIPVSAAPDKSVGEFFAGISDEALQDIGTQRHGLIDGFVAFMARMEQLQAKEERVRNITIIGGLDKDGQEENMSVNLAAGEVVSIVGPTGSGKSRLLADIEWMAQQDTPTGRTILVNGQTPDETRRFSIEDKLVAQLSQNMNFVMDLTVEEFVTMHAESKLAENIAELTAGIINKANELAGEKFSPGTPVTALSGGQSRALMIADAAFLSACPIVLIDEIENAGIDRKQALRLLVDQDKIVLMATHDPILALMGDRRLVIRNGGISQVLATSPEERRSLAVLEKMDRQLAAVRELLRGGGRIDSIVDEPDEE